MSDVRRKPTNRLAWSTRVGKMGFLSRALIRTPRPCPVCLALDQGTSSDFWTGQKLVCVCMSVLRNRDLEQSIRADCKVTRTDRVAVSLGFSNPGSHALHRTGPKTWVRVTQPSDQCDLQLRHQGTPNREAQPPFVQAVRDT